ncbi:MAG: hypothetical protein U9N49_13410 [Campylobacterota bacterium]|nr:hypothetical protein [Campylobacterota bacterium]
MSNKLGLSIVASITLLLTGCGGGGGAPTINEEATNAQEQTAQTLCQVEGSNVIIGDEESCEYNNQMLSCSNGRVTLGGMNAETINLNGTQYICASTYNSALGDDTNSEEQKASESNIAENLLNGKTLYETYENQAKNREYFSTRFESDLAYVELFAVDGNVLKSSTIYDLVYSGDTITYIAQDGSGSEKECTVEYDSEYIQSYQFTCTNEQGETRYEYMSNTSEDAIQYPVISTSDRTFEATDIVNGDFILSNEILNFSIRNLPKTILPT